MTVLSYFDDIIMDRAINSPRHEKNVMDGLNKTDKHCFKEQMELLGKLSSNDT